MTKKVKFIDRMDTLSPKEKKQVISFFTKHPNYENRIDWNRKVLHYCDFEKVFSIAEESAKNQKRKAKDNPLPLFKKYNCEIIYRNESIILAVPLDWECAVFFDSYKCGGEGAKWCIGDSKDFHLWNYYTWGKNIFVLVYFTEIQPVFRRKILIEFNTNSESIIIWLQNNKKIKSQNRFNMLDKHFNIFSKIKERSKELLQRIIVPEYYIEGSVLKRWYNFEAVEVNLPANITAIESSAFQYCPQLEKIIVDADNNTYSSDSGVLYNKEKTSLIRCPQGKTGSFIIPNKVKSIEYRAFNGCTNLTSVNMPDSVANIDIFAFGHNSKLEKIIVDAYNNSYSSDSGVLYNKEKTELILCPQEKSGSFTIPNSVTSIKGCAFSGCINLTDVVIPDSVTSIEMDSFNGCTGLTSIIIPNSVTSIDECALSWCINLVKVTFECIITKENLNFSAFKGLGNLRKKYFEEGPGTYTRAIGGKVWKKQ